VPLPVDLQEDDVRQYVNEQPRTMSELNAVAEDYSQNMSQLDYDGVSRNSFVSPRAVDVAMP
jgi:uncharacterized protein YjcR